MTRTRVRALPLLVLVLAPVVLARAADNVVIQRLAFCQDSWFEWKDDPVRMKALADAFQSAFVRKPFDAFFVPKTTVTIAGLPVLRAFPESVGMGVGFSVIVDATFDAARKNVEKAIGKTLKGCETSDNMRTCGLEVGDKKTLTIMSGDDKKSATTLVGCYYFYAK